MGIESLFYACCEEIKQVFQEEAVLRTEQMLYVRGMLPLGQDDSGVVNLYTQEEFDAAIFSALANYQRSCSSVEATIKVLIERQKSIEKLGQSLVVRLKAIQNSGGGGQLTS